jgi:hypothetical protein
MGWLAALHMVPISVKTGPVIGALLITASPAPTTVKLATFLPLHRSARSNQRAVSMGILERCNRPRVATATKALPGPAGPFLLD